MANLDVLRTDAVGVEGWDKKTEAVVKDSDDPERPIILTLQMREQGILVKEFRVIVSKGRLEHEGEFLRCTESIEERNGQTVIEDTIWTGKKVQVEELIMAMKPHQAAQEIWMELMDWAESL